MSMYVYVYVYLYVYVYVYDKLDMIFGLKSEHWGFTTQFMAISMGR